MDFTLPNMKKKGRRQKTTSTATNALLSPFVKETVGKGELVSLEKEAAKKAAKKAQEERDRVQKEAQEKAKAAEEAAKKAAKKAQEERHVAKIPIAKKAQEERDCVENETLSKEGKEKNKEIESSLARSATFQGPRTRTDGGVCPCSCFLPLPFG